MQTHVLASAEQTKQQNAKAAQQPAPLLAEPQAVFEDNRPESIQLKAMQATMSASPQAAQLKAMQTMMNDHSQAQKLQAMGARMSPGSQESLQQMPLSGIVAPVQRAEGKELRQDKLEAESLQKKAISAQDPTPPQESKPNDTGLTNQVKKGIESLSGMSMDHVRVHYNSNKPAQLQAHAYTQGSEIYVAPGQEKHVPHEAWHVVQQSQGRVKPTMQMKGNLLINDDTGLEQEADVMGEKILVGGIAPLDNSNLVKLTQNPPLKGTVQGKWFRMSSIIDESDEIAVRDIQILADQHNYVDAFNLLLKPYASLKEEFQKILFVTKKYNAFDKLNQKLGELFRSEGKAYTASEVLEIFDEELKKDSDLGEQYQTDMYSPQERGLMAVEEIQGMIRNKVVTDEVGLEEKFQWLAEKYGMTQIQLNRGTKPATVKFKINPEFEMELTGGHAVEMRSAGSGTGANKTKVLWTPQTLNLNTTTNPGGGSYTVGGYMRANPLSQDHPPGTKAAADSDHTGMMAKLPAAGNRKKTGSGSGPYYYIKGHLLNDNLGGIANEANLFPITHEANGQHKSYVEEYIKKGISEGYVYRYEVNIANVKVKDEPLHGGYAVDSEIQFSFARLDSAQKDVSGTEHKGKVESTYEITGAEPFDKSTEYAKDSPGSYNHPKPVGTEDIYKTSEKSVLTSNTGLTGTVTTFGHALAGGSKTLGSAQSINASATLTPTGKSLSMRQSQAANVINHFQPIVTGWNLTDMTDWVNHVQKSTYAKWDQVFDSAVTTYKLEKAMADEIRKKYLVRVTINGKPVGT